MLFHPVCYSDGKLISKGGKQEIKADDEVIAGAEVCESKKRIRKLERVLGRTMLDNKIAKNPFLLRAKKLISRLLCLP